MNELREGDVVRYDPPPRKGLFSGTDPRWCVEGMGVVQRRPDDSLVVVDTYWGGGPDQRVYSPDEIDPTVLFNLDDYVPVRDYERFAPADRGLLTRQHGCERLYYVRKGATEDSATIVENARVALREAQDELRSAQSRVEWRERDLARLVAEYGAPTEASR